CAAMAADPVAATVSLALPNDMEMAESKALIDGMAAMADEYDLAIVGGDTTRWARPLAIDVAVLARPYDGVEPVTRAGARVGDILYVTGPLGGSRLGRHLDFVPRVRESLELATRLGQRLHALIDLSDGLSLDLWRVCRASGVGATLDEALLERVISDDARRLAEQDGLTPIEHALQDGEDFELLAAVEGRVAVSGVTLHEIGHVTETGLWIRQVNGGTDPLEPNGFVH
ncbi:MAG: thiamine-monophosphate kinase, partial [Phycisphaerae bacterium]